MPKTTTETRPKGDEMTAEEDQVTEEALARMNATLDRIEAKMAKVLRLVAELADRIAAASRESGPGASSSA